MSISLQELLARVNPEVEAQVRRVRDRVRGTLQEAIRAECRLVMRTAKESESNKAGAHVPVNIAPGYPEGVINLTFPDDLAQIMFLARFRKSFENARDGTNGMMELLKNLWEVPNYRQALERDDRAIYAVHECTGALIDLLDHYDPVTALLKVNEDILGVYQYAVDEYETDDTVPNKAEIFLYWAVIGLVSDWLGCSVDDLTIVVFAHELAHAYTQLGADIEGRRWPSQEFAHAQHALKEGLAQYYTHRVLDRMQARLPGAFPAYQLLLQKQPEAYSSHLPWVKQFSPEAVRRAMIETRRWRECTVDEFNIRLERAECDLQFSLKETLI